MLLEEAPLAVCARTWFQHDGAPAQFSQQLRETFGNRWMGHLGLSHGQQDHQILILLMYATHVDHVDDLPRIVDGCNTIRTTPGLL